MIGAPCQLAFVEGTLECLTARFTKPPASSFPVVPGVWLVLFHCSILLSLKPWIGEQSLETVLYGDRQASGFVNCTVILYLAYPGAAGQVSWRFKATFLDRKVIDLDLTLCGINQFEVFSKDGKISHLSDLLKLLDQKIFPWNKLAPAYFCKSGTR